MKSNQLPFDDISTQTDIHKSVPKQTEEFAHYVEYLASSPQIDPSAISGPILQFLNLPKYKTQKPERREIVLNAIRDLNLPEDFWSQVLPQFKTELSEPENKFHASILMALTSAPPSSIVKIFNNFNFLIPFLDNENDHIRYSAFFALYKFRNYIKIDNKVVELTLQQLTNKLPQIAFIAIYLLKFYISVDYQNISELIKPSYNHLKRVIYINGHILNINILRFLFKLIQPSIQELLSMIPHVSYPAAGFIISAMPSCNDFNHLADVPADSVLPVIVDIINHPYCDGITMELLTTALQIIKMTQNMHFFERITDHMLKSNRSCKIQIISLFADVAKSIKELPRILNKASQFSKESDFFNNLVSISSFIATKDNVDITKELLKLLSSESTCSSWKLAASCVAYYAWHQKQFALNEIQNFLEIVKTINDLSIRSLFLIYLADFIPIHLRSDLISAMKLSLFSNSDKGLQSTTTKNTFSMTDTDDSIPMLIKIQLVSSLSMISTDEDLDDIYDRLSQPIFKIALQNGVRNRSTGKSRSSLPANASLQSTIPLSPFLHVDVIDLGLLASGLYYPTTLPVASTNGKIRDFVEISPVYHALTVEMASVVVPTDRSLSIELRLSAKCVVPSLSVSFNVPITLTPPQVPEWSINGLNEGSKVTQTYSFTVNQLINPFAMIHIEQDGANVLDIKVCLPLIDLFDKIQPDEDISKNIWQNLHYQQKNIHLSDGMWVSHEGIIAIKDGVARATSEEFLNMIPSANETHAVVE